MPIHVLVVDDHPIVRGGLVGLIKHEEDISVVGMATNGVEAIEAVAQHKPDIVIMDISMPKLNGIDATREICKLHRGVRVIGLTMHSGTTYHAAMKQAGAHGIVLKGAACDDLIKVIRTVYAGGEYWGTCTEESVRAAEESADDTKSMEWLFSKLTPREREVLQFIGEGMTVNEIADRLHISIHTVHTHRRHLKEKLLLSTTGELVKYAIKVGLVKT